RLRQRQEERILRAVRERAAVLGERRRGHRLNRLLRVGERLNRERHARGILGPRELLQRLHAQLVARLARRPLAPLGQLLLFGEDEDRLLLLLRLFYGELLGILSHADRQAHREASDGENADQDGDGLEASALEVAVAHVVPASRREAAQ